MGKPNNLEAAIAHLRAPALNKNMAAVGMVSSTTFTPNFSSVCAVN